MTLYSKYPPSNKREKDRIDIMVTIVVMDIIPESVNTEIYDEAVSIAVLICVGRVASFKILKGEVTMSRLRNIRDSIAVVIILYGGSLTCGRSLPQKTTKGYLLKLCL